MKRIPVLIILMMMLASCGNEFIDHKAYRLVREDFSQRSELLSAAGIKTDTMDVSRNARKALEFLYAYMPLGDMLNYTPEFYRECVECTEKAVEEMPWGRSVPARELRHFVLPPRINNENLDGCRPVFYDELAPRVKGLSMYEAVLEVNHWCHEKVTYRPTDSRTSAPLSTVRTAWGRCGEESTLLVAALRSVAIPARQVYTPRWAHTDDNHAWVEAWVDGKWHFLGACEPEAVLDLGWFNAPASRGMLMNTNVFGHYDGPEEKLAVTPLSTTINVVANYAPEPCRLDVRVIDRDGNPVPGATVEYKIYNYAEFYTVAVLETDSEGESGITLGNGDLLVYASDSDGRFGYAVTSAKRDDTLVITLEYNGESDFSVVNSMPSFTIVPPAENPVIPQVDEAVRAACSARLSREDSLRNAYSASFINEAAARDFASENSFDADAVADILKRSCGNWSEVMAFLAKATKDGRQGTALRMLRLVSEKDLRDTPADVLLDHLCNVPDDASDKILSPRIANELLRPWRGGLKEAVPQQTAAMVAEDPSAFVKWCTDSLTLCRNAGSSYIAPGPLQVWKSRLCDVMSRDIFFVAMCRTFGVEAWIDGVTGAVRYRSGGLVYDVNFETAAGSEHAFGRLMLGFEPFAGLDDPRYYSNFTLSHFNGKRFALLEYSDDAAYSKDFSGGINLEPGLYLITTGIRMASGAVCSTLRLFRIKEGETTDAELVFGNDETNVRVTGSFDSELKYLAMPEKETKSLLSTTGRGYFTTIVLDAKSEPSVHVLKDLEAASAGLEDWGRPVMLIFESLKSFEDFDPKAYRLPRNVRLGVDADGSIAGAIRDEMNHGNPVQLPVVLVSDTFNRVVHYSSGYAIGTGDQLLNLASRL